MSGSYPKANAPLQSVMIPILTVVACEPPASAPEVATVAATPTSARGSKSFHLPTFIVPPLVPAHRPPRERTREPTTVARSIPAPPHDDGAAAALVGSVSTRGGPPRCLATSHNRSQSPMRPSGDTI